MYADVHVEINPRNGSEPANPQPANESAPQTAQSTGNASETQPLNSENNAGTPINNGKSINCCLYYSCFGIDSINAFFLKELTITVDLGAEQPRVTTATHPTTSTQTRSTARPQVHLASIPASHMRSLRPVPIPAIQLSSFDRFLPCNSHHVRENQERAPRPHLHVARRGTIRRRTVNFQRVPQGTWNRLEGSIIFMHSMAYRKFDLIKIADEIASRDSDVLIRLFGCEIPLRDLINLTPSPSIFNRIRSDLRAYVTQRFGTPPDMSGVMQQQQFIV